MATARMIAEDLLLKEINRLGNEDLALNRNYDEEVEDSDGLYPSAKEGIVQVSTVSEQIKEKIQAFKEKTQAFISDLKSLDDNKELFVYTANSVLPTIDAGPLARAKLLHYWAIRQARCGNYAGALDLEKSARILAPFMESSDVVRYKDIVGGSRRSAMTLPSCLVLFGMQEDEISEELILDTLNLFTKRMGVGVCELSQDGVESLTLLHDCIRILKKWAKVKVEIVAETDNGKQSNCGLSLDGCKNCRFRKFWWYGDMTSTDLKCENCCKQTIQLEKNITSNSELDGYEFMSTIAMGRHCIVRLVKDQKTNEIFTCKTIDLKCNALDFEREASLLTFVSGKEGVVRLKETKSSAGYLHIVMERLKPGGLIDEILSRPEDYSEKMVSKIIHNLAKIINCLHKEGIMHCDINPQNLLAVLGSGSGSLSFKVIDFSVAKRFKQGEKFVSSHLSIPYSAPEIISHSLHGPEVDIWSLGVILCVLLTGFPPFMSDDITDKYFCDDTLDKICGGAANINFRSKCWSNVSKGAKDLVKKLLRVNPNERPSITKMLDNEDAEYDEWLNGVGASADPIEPLVLEKLKGYQDLLEIVKFQKKCNMKSRLVAPK